MNLDCMKVVRKIFQEIIALSSIKALTITDSIIIEITGNYSKLRKIDEDAIIWIRVVTQKTAIKIIITYYVQSIIMLYFVNLAKP